MLQFDHAQITHPGFTLTAHWQVAQGQRLAIIGPSGAGKSTLLMAIAGFQPLQSGYIQWQTQNLASLTPAQRPVSILFQDQNLFPHLTLTQNLGLALSPRLRLTAEHHAKINETLTRLGLSDKADRRPASLSGGQQARAALARALLQDRPILLLDEPFAALGPALKTDLLTLVQTTAADKLVLMVTHDPADARRFAEATVLVADGIAHPPVETETLFNNPPKALADYLGT